MSVPVSVSVFVYVNVCMSVSLSMYICVCRRDLPYIVGVGTNGDALTIAVDVPVALALVCVRTGEDHFHRSYLPRLHETEVTLSTYGCVRIMLLFHTAGTALCNNFVGQNTQLSTLSWCVNVISCCVLLTALYYSVSVILPCSTVCCVPLCKPAVFY